MRLDGALGAAHKVTEAAREAKVEIAVAVCDHLGRVKVFLEMDGTDSVMVGIEAMRRAIRAADTGKPSDDLSTSAHASVESEGIGGSTRPGGLPCLRKEDTFGSVGVAGVDDDLCVRLAKIGVDALPSS